MKTCSLLLRSWMVPLHPQFLQRSQATVSNFPMMRGHQAPSSISAFTNKNTASITRRGICLFQSPFHAKSGTYRLDGGRSLSLASPISYSQYKCLSSSSSSFEAPEPPKSKGQPVFPDIQFQNQSTPSSPKSENAAYARNSDPEAVFVVNGSSRGIGLQFVKSLAERSKGKIIACCRSPSAAAELNEFASTYPERIEILPLDMENQPSIDNLSASIAKTYGRVDALFNVAGILGDGISTPGPERSLAAIDRDWMGKTLAVNVIGPVMLVKALSPLMRTVGRRSVMIDAPSDVQSNPDEAKSQFKVDLPGDRPPTVIVNLSARVGSISDNQLGGWYTYRLSKAALNQATKTMGLELKRQGTWIVALHPGTTNTDLSKPFQRNVKEGRLFPVDFTVDSLLGVVESMSDENSGGFYDWAGKSLPF